MNKLRDLLIDGVLMALPLGAVAFLVLKVVGVLVPLLDAALGTARRTMKQRGLGLLQLAAVPARDGKAAATRS